MCLVCPGMDSWISAATFGLWPARIPAGPQRDALDGVPSRAGWPRRDAQPPAALECRPETRVGTAGWSPLPAGEPGTEHADRAHRAHTAVSPAGAHRSSGLAHVTWSGAVYPDPSGTGS